MKKIFKIIILAISISCNSQEGNIVPLTTTYLEFQSGTYEKDINNEFNRFVGSWYVIDNNIKYTLVLQKMEHLLVTNSSTFYYYRDELIGKYEARDINTNTVLYSTMSATEYNEFEITSLGGVYDGHIEFNFFDRERCNHKMVIRLYGMTFHPGTTLPYQLKYYNYGDDWNSEDCPYTNIEDIPFALPFGSFTLTKE